MRPPNTFQNRVLDASKLVSTKTLYLVKRYYRHQGNSVAISATTVSCHVSGPLSCSVTSVLLQGYEIMRPLSAAGVGKRRAPLTFLHAQRWKRCPRSSPIGEAPRSASNSHSSASPKVSHEKGVHIHPVTAWEREHWFFAALEPFRAMDFGCQERERSFVQYFGALPTVIRRSSVAPNRRF